MTGMMHNRRKKVPTCCKCHIARYNCGCQCHRKMTPKEKAYEKKVLRRIIFFLILDVVALIAMCAHDHYYPADTRICIQYGNLHKVIHHGSTGNEYSRMEYDCLQYVPDPNRSGK